jgi:hypothetical protein
MVVHPSMRASPETGRSAFRQSVTADPRRYGALSSPPAEPTCLSIRARASLTSASTC